MTEIDRRKQVIVKHEDIADFEARWQRIARQLETDGIDVRNPTNPQTYSFSAVMHHLINEKFEAIEENEG